MKVNQRLEITLLHNTKIEHYNSRIEEITPTCMLLAMPISKGYPIILQAGDYFYGKVIVEGSAYKFTCNYYDKRAHPLPVWVVSLPYDIKKVQLRAFVRISVALPAKIHFFPLEEHVPLDLCTKDVAGGGVQVVAKHSIPIGTKLQLSLTVPDAGILDINSEVVRVEQPQQERAIFWIGIKFIDIPEKDRSKIIKYIFKKQLERRNRKY